MSRNTVTDGTKEIDAGAGPVARLAPLTRRPRYRPAQVGTDASQQLALTFLVVGTRAGSNVAC